MIDAFRLVMCRSNRRDRIASQRAGISMIEVVVSIALVATLMLITMQASASIMRMQQEDREAVFAAKLIEIYAAETTSMDFRDRIDPTFGLETGETVGTRSNYDDIDDYHNQTFAPPTYRDAQAIPLSEGWTASFLVDVADEDGTLLSQSEADIAPLRRIQITCTSPNGSTFTEIVWVSGVPNDLDPLLSFQRMRSVTLGFPNGVDVKTVVPMRNTPEANPWE